jgi:endonuclease YncB( thermonuclease family)
MKLRLSLNLICIILLLIGLSSIERKVKFVYDGDTILINNGDQIRYIGIDTPEMDYNRKEHEFMAKAAKRFNERLIKGKKVRLETDIEKKDRYGRTLAYVFLQDGTMVNLKLIERGLARVMTTRSNKKYRSLFIEAQQRAMESRLGIWSRLIKPDKGPFPASIKSYRFHKPTCPFAKRISHKNKILFKTRRAAYYQGYYPCSRCRP